MQQRRAGRCCICPDTGGPLDERRSRLQPSRFWMPAFAPSAATGHLWHLPGAAMQIPMFPKKVLDDLGKVGNGVTNPSLVRADDGLTYVIKDDSGGTGQTVRASEFLWATIATAISLPCALAEVIETRTGEIAVGTRYESSHRQRQMDLLAGRVDRGGFQLSRIYAFDLFAANWDRHYQNYIVVDDGVGGAIVRAIDFSHTTVHPGLCRMGCDPTAFIGVATRAQFPRIVQPYGPDVAAALAVIDRLRGLPATTVDAILENMPDDWLDRAHRQAVSAWWSGTERTTRADLVQQGLQDGTFI